MSVLNDTEFWSLARLGFLLYSRERLQEAGAVFHGLIQLDPQASYCWYALGLVRRKQGDVRSAIESLNRAVGADQTFWEARVALAEVLRENGYAQDAMEVLKPVTKAPSTRSSAVRRGKTLWRCWSRR